MIICEREFQLPSRENPTYAHGEVDFFARPQRLSLRKNLESGKFELYFHQHSPDRDEIVITSEDLLIVLNKANQLIKIHHPEFSERDEVCDHKSCKNKKL